MTRTTASLLAAGLAFAGMSARAQSPASPSPMRAAAFLSTLGVNTHISWQNVGSGYKDAAIVEASLAYLGVKHVRDGIPFLGWTLSEYTAIADTGVSFDILASGPKIDIASDLVQLDQLARMAPGSVASIEGANEFNTGSYVFDGVSSSNDPAWAQNYGAALYAAVKADKSLSGVQVVAASMASAGAAQVAQEGNVGGFADSVNWHCYYGSGDQPGRGLDACVAAARSTAPGKPVSITETGYYTAVDAMDWGGGGVTPAVQAILTLNVLFDAFRAGVQTTYLYELMDNIANPATTDLEDNFGLFLADGTPKPAATAIHNLTGILADTGANATSFKPAAFSASIVGMPSTAHALVLAKSSGRFDIVIWNEAAVWKQATKSPVTPAPVTVTVNLDKAYYVVAVYNPIYGPKPIEEATNLNTQQLPLGGTPFIVEVTPVAVP